MSEDHLIFKSIIKIIHSFKSVDDCLNISEIFYNLDYMYYPNVHKQIKILVKNNYLKKVRVNNRNHYKLTIKGKDYYNNTKHLILTYG
jgi:predicted transcriptional regulator